MATLNDSLSSNQADRGVTAMTLSDIIKNRRSIQLYEEKTVPVEELKELLETAIWVPNHKMTEPWRFVFIRGDSRKPLADINRKLNEKGTTVEERNKNGEVAYKKIMDVPVFLMVVMNENPNMKLREEDYAATSCVVHNFSLLAWEKGIGMIWKTNQLTTNEEVRATYDIQPGEKIAAMLQIGYPAKVPKERPRKEAKTLISEFK
ncbi:nitroreductase [Radiobacillus kanasensis]|uniref:nitroreductase family protein n=1 Tax=Radiobacillus kanasensis TaxID=2844358 RepID=UPI001E2E2F4E|nr:nitroreductase [Radiobacillus kanasensis]UFT99081.1 nitroreductase [Radiobacillus kanasensis]